MTATQDDPSETMRRIEAEIASDDSPVGIDAKKTHVLILAKLESIERRLDRLESAGTGVPKEAATETEMTKDVVNGDVKEAVLGTLAFAGNTFDDAVGRLAKRGVDVDARARRALSLLEQLTDEKLLATLEQALRTARDLPGLLAAAGDTLDAEVARMADDGVSVDAALRNGLKAILRLGQTLSPADVDAMSTLLRSNVLHPRAVDVIGRAACALVAASEGDAGKVGPVRAAIKLSDEDRQRSTAFLLEFSKQFGQLIGGMREPCPTPPARKS